jgi:hypothetical protein
MTDLDEQLAEMEQHAREHRTKAVGTGADNSDDGGLTKSLTDVFNRVTRQQRLDAGRKTLQIKSFTTD